jgi:predicted SnoaL-like aldol condensation-catalyzing enzyme
VISLDENKALLGKKLSIDKVTNLENDNETLLNVEDIILDRLVSLHITVNNSISYQKLKDSAGAITSENFDTSLEDLVAQSLIQSPDGENYHITEYGINEYERRKIEEIYSTNIKRAEKVNEELALRYHNDIFQEGKLEVADEILSPDFVLHNPSLPEELRKGPEGVKKYASAIIESVSDRKLVQNDIFAKGDKVLIRWTNSGTNMGLYNKTLFGNKPTGKQYVATGFDQFRISNGKIIEMWQQYNYDSWP